MTLPQRIHFIYETHREFRKEFIRTNLQGQEEEPKVRISTWEFGKQDINRKNLNDPKTTSLFSMT